MAWAPLEANLHPGFGAICAPRGRAILDAGRFSSPSRRFVHYRAGTDRWPAFARRGRPRDVCEWARLSSVENIRQRAAWTIISSSALATFGSARRYNLALKGGCHVRSQEEPDADA